MLAVPNSIQVVESLMVLGVWRVALVIQLDARSGVEGAWGQVMEKVLKLSPNGRPRVVFGEPFGGLEPPWDRFGRHIGVPRCYFSRYVNETCAFAISMPICSGIATFEGLGTQVEATWAEKSRPNRLLGALATVECEVLCESYGNRWELPRIARNSDQVRGQSLSSRPFI